MRLLVPLAVGLLLSTSAALRAEPLLQPPSPKPVPNDDEPEPPLVPDAADTLGGHFIVGARGGLVVPWGDLAQGTSAGDLGGGYGAGADLGFGLSRSVVIGVWGQIFNYSNSPDCGTEPRRSEGCTAMSYALGPFVRYHLVQGMRFDPWLSAGLGYSAMSVESSSGTADYAGVEWLKLSVGGDYYPFRSVGFGPMLEFETGVFGKHPEGDNGVAAHFSFIAGLRLVLDVPGK
jgi:hypothetical protein